MLKVSLKHDYFVVSIVNLRRFCRTGLQELSMGLMLGGLVMCVPHAFAGAQQEETLSSAFQLALHLALTNAPPPNPEHLNESALRDEFSQWVAKVDPKLERYLKARHKDFDELATSELRSLFLQTVWYESTRARLDPALALGVIEVESGFNKFAISSAGAVGYMQVMPFWMSKALEHSDLQVQQNQSSQLNSSTQLLRLQTNIRFGCTILRHYLDTENLALGRALGRYNGNVLDDNYARAVTSARMRWTTDGLPTAVTPRN